MRTGPGAVEDGRGRSRASGGDLRLATVGRRAVAPALGLAVSLPIAALLRVDGFTPLELRWLVSVSSAPGGGGIGGWSADARSVGELEAEGLAATLSLTLALALLGWLAALASSLLGSFRRIAEDREAWALRSAVGATHRQIRGEALRIPLASSVLACVAGTTLAAAGCELLALGLPTGLTFDGLSGAATLPGAPLVALLLGATLLAGTCFPLAMLPPARELRRPARVVTGDGSWWLAAGQVAAAVAVAACAAVLATGAPQMEDTMARYPHARDTLVLRVHLPAGLMAGERAGQWAETREAVERLPGVRAAAVASTGGFLGLGTMDRTVAECPGCSSGGLGVPVTLGRARYIAVGPGFFAVTGFGPVGAEEAESGEAWVDSRFRRELFSGNDPLGRAVWLRGAFPLRTPGHEVVGAMEAPPPIGLGTAEPAGGVYLSLDEHPPVVADIAVRGAGESVAAGGLATLVIASVERLAPGARVETLGRLDEIVRARSDPVRWLAAATVGLTAVALLLALSGLADAMVQRVRARRSEIGVRKAVGARRRDIVRLVLADGLRLALVGGAFGGARGAAANRGLPALVGGLEPLPALGIIALGAGVLLLGLAGATRAGLRAARLDPVVALRG